MSTGEGRCEAISDRFEQAMRRGAISATDALSRWLGREARIAVNRACLAEMAEAVEALGPADSLVAACGITLGGAVPGTVLMVFDDRSAMAMVDALLGQPEGTARDWGPLERSAAQETANIVACAFVNALADAIGPGAPMLPGPPEFRLEFAGSLLQFAVIDQATRSDRIVLVETRFAIDGVDNAWSLVIVPTADGLAALGIGPGDRPPGDGGDRGTSRSMP